MVSVKAAETAYLGRAVRTVEAEELHVDGIEGVVV
jgi:hypothetical protein